MTSITKYGKGVNILLHMVEVMFLSAYKRHYIYKKFYASLIVTKKKKPTVDTKR